MIAMITAVGATVSIVESSLQALGEFDVELAPSAIMAIDLANYCRNYWYTLIVPAALDLGLLIGLGFAPPRFNWLAWFWSTLWFLCAILFLASTSSAISVPVTALTQRLAN
jgi:hypothetical protein